MGDEKALTPIDQRTVDFYGDHITAVLVQTDAGEQIFVADRPICDFLGVSWTGQRRRINRDPVLSQEIKRVNVTFTDSRHEAMLREVLCLPLDFLNGFLFGLNPTRAKEEVRVKQAIAFLSSRHTAVIREMKRRMRHCASRLEFEKAQRIKEQVGILERALEKQIVERHVNHDQDVIYIGDGKALVGTIKRGALQGIHLFDLDTSFDGKACEQFLLSRYGERSPRELIVNRLSDPDRIAATLTAANQYKVKITLPKRGVACKLLQLCELNYDYRVTNENLRLVDH
ncbi:MAG TPA: phage antirepressor N-terminal domain-containing protein [Anaerolineae bacterium]